MGLPRVAPALRLLRGLPDDAGAIRARSLDALQALDLSDGVAIVGLSTAPDAGAAIRWGITQGACRTIYQRAVAPGSSAYVYTALDLRRAPPIERRSFRSLAQLGDRGMLLESPGWVHLYAAARVCDQARLLVTRDDEIVATIFVVRGVGAPLFYAGETRVLSKLVEPLRRALGAADALERDGAPDGPADLVLDPRGRVRFASVGAQAWLERSGFREHLAGLVRGADRERAPSSTHAGGLIDLVRIHGEGGRVRYLAHVAPMPRLRLAPAAALTRAQQEIAELAAAGATLPEIARMKGRTLETVRAHVKAIYERLGVASRAELARALDAST